MELSSLSYILSSAPIALIETCDHPNQRKLTELIETFFVLKGSLFHNTDSPQTVRDFDIIWKIVFFSSTYWNLRVQFGVITKQSKIKHQKFVIFGYHWNLQIKPWSSLFSIFPENIDILSTNKDPGPPNLVSRITDPRVIGCSGIRVNGH